MIDPEFDLGIVEGSNGISRVLVDQNLRFEGVNGQVLQLLPDVLSPSLSKDLQELLVIADSQEVVEIAHRFVAGQSLLLGREVQVLQPESGRVDHEKGSVVVVPTELANRLHDTSPNELDPPLRIVVEDLIVQLPKGEGLRGQQRHLHVLLNGRVQGDRLEFPDPPAVLVDLPEDEKLVVVEPIEVRGSGIRVLLQLLIESLPILRRNGPQLEVLRELLVAGEQIDDGVLVGLLLEDSEERAVVGHRDALGVDGLRVGDPLHEANGDEEEEDGEHDGQHPPLVLDIDEQLGQSDPHPEGRLPIGVAVLEAVRLLGLIGEALIALRNEDEPGLSLRVPHVLVGVVLQRQFSS